MFIGVGDDLVNTAAFGRGDRTIRGRRWLDRQLGTVATTLRAFERGLPGRRVRPPGFGRNAGSSRALDLRQSRRHGLGCPRCSRCRPLRPGWRVDGRHDGGGRDVASAGALRRACPRRQPDVGWDFEPDIQAPVLVVNGELDALPANGVERAEETAAMLPDGRLHVVAGAGHVPTLTRPDEVASTIQTFLARAG